MMRLTTGSMLQVARDIRVDDHVAADRRRQTAVNRDAFLPDGAPTIRAARPTGLRRLISLGLLA